MTKRFVKIYVSIDVFVICVCLCIFPSYGRKKKLWHLDFDLTKTSWRKMGANLSGKKKSFCGVLALIHKTVS